MSKELTTLEIKSSNPDINGVWYKDEVEKEMEELGLYPPHYDGWIGYVISHFDFPSYIDETLESDNVYELKFMLEDDNVHVMKS